jgi:O-antigen/teichoic acid export membrane protein
MVMLERLGGSAGEKNAGLYAAAYRWLDAFMMYLWTILPVFFAKFAAHHNEPDEQQELFNFGQLITFFPLMFAGVFVFFYGDKFFWIFTHSTPEELKVMTSTLKILFITAIFQGMFAIYGTYLNATGHEKRVSYMIAGCIALNVLLNGIFIPSYGPVAAAYATLASTALISVMYLNYIPKNTALKIPLNLLGRIGVIAAGFIIFFFILYSFSVVWYVTTVVSGIFLAGIMYITNIGNIRSVLNKS